MSRQYSLQFKIDLLEELDGVNERGGVGKILRQRGVHSSLVSKWRKQRDEGTLQASDGKKRGPKVDRVAAELRRVREENERLKARLETQERLSVAQGNALALLQELSRRSDNTT